VTVACRHEHISHDDVCGECVASLIAHRMVCVACDELPTGAHVCPSTLVGAAVMAEGPLEAEPVGAGSARAAAPART
jgi:hypothetical protein